MKRRKVGTIGGKVPNKGLTSAKDLTIELHEGRESLYHKLV